MGWKYRGIVFVAVLTGSASWLTMAPAYGQQAPPNQQSPGIKTTISLVLVDALAQEKKSGAPIPDLQQDDFLLRDNGKTVAITSFNRGKDQKLRPIQLWFVLMCNEQVHSQMGGRRRAQVESTEQWGVSFMAGRTGDLRPALEHLNAGDTVGVAHWCDDGQSEIDVPPSGEYGPALEVMDQIARRKAVMIEQDSGSDARAEVTGLINNMASSAFPEPFLAMIFIGGKQTGNQAGNSGDPWSGFMEVSSMDFGAGNSSNGTESLEFAVKGSDYINRLGTYLDNLHIRYEIGFAPNPDAKKLQHKVSITLTKGAKEKYPDAVLRYRDVYSDAAASEKAELAKHLTNWKELDSRMREAVKSPTDLKDLKFIAEKTSGAPGGREQFLVRIPQNDLTWKTLPNGDRRCVVMAVVASYSAKGQPALIMVKQLEIVEQFDRLPTLKDKPVMLSLRVNVGKSAAKVRVLVRDVATGHIGAQDIQMAEERHQESAKAGGEGAR